MRISRSQTATTSATAGIFWISSMWPSAILPQPTMAILRAMSVARLHGLLLAEEGGLRGGEARDGDAEGRARDVIEADLAEEADRGRVAPVLAADAELELRARLPPALGRELDQGADADEIEGLERVLRE